MTSTSRIFILLLAFLSVEGWCNDSSLTTANHRSPSVVVSIPPFYHLVAGVMEGVNTPKLLIKEGASPHDYTLRPSDLQMLKEADVILWAGPELESFLVKPLSTADLKQSVYIVQLDQLPLLHLLPVRQSPHWEPHDHNHENGHEFNHGASHTLDMHFWLAPNNASVLIDAIVKQLSKADTEHATIYQKNGKQLKQQLKTLDIQIKRKLKPVKTVAFIVFHDAYQYFERYYGLKGVGAITLHPELPPSVQRLMIIRDTIKKTQAHCVFTEPQFQPKLVQSILQDTNVNTGILDPLGSISTTHKNGYFELLENLSDSLSHCLQQPIFPQPVSKNQ
jgi:zinc transport system substrate-binding protein